MLISVTNQYMELYLSMMVFYQQQRFHNRTDWPPVIQGENEIMRFRPLLCAALKIGYGAVYQNCHSTSFHEIGPFELIGRAGGVGAASFPDHTFG